MSLAGRIEAFFNAEVDGRYDRVLVLFSGTVLLLLMTSQDLPRGLAAWAIGRPIAAVLWSAVAVPSVAAALGLFLCGWHPRLSGGCAAIAMAVSYLLCPSLYQSNRYTGWLLLVLSLMAPSASYGLAWLRTGEDPPRAPALVVNLVRAQLLIIYVYTVVAKLTDPFWSGPQAGQVLDHVVAIRTSAGGNLLAVLFAWSFAKVPTLPRHLAHLVMGVEALVPVLLIRRRWRGLAFVVGSLMHVAMQELLHPGLFTFVVLIGYYAFVPSGDRAYVATYDPEVSWMRGLCARYRSLDWLGRVAWRAEPGAGRLTLAGPTGRGWRAPGALVRLLLLTPATLIAYALLALFPLEGNVIFSVPRELVELCLVSLAGAAWVGTELRRLIEPMALPE